MRAGLSRDVYSLSRIRSKLLSVQFFFFQAQSDKPSSLCVSQVEASWSPSLSAYSPCSWWLSSASTSECSAIFVFTFPWRRLFMVDACKDYGNLSANVWFNPITPGRHIPNLPLWNMFVDIDTEMEKKNQQKKIGNGQRHPLFIHKKPLWRSVKGVLSTF